MTKEKVNNLEVQVAVIQNDICTLKDDAKSMKSLLRWFIVLCLGVMSVFITNWMVTSGDKKTMQDILKHNSIVIGDMAAQGIEKGWYEPSKETYRGLTKE